jgi:hypothetical protein
MDVTIQPDGSAMLAYDIHFQNDPGGHPIDVIDIGMPNNDYDFSSTEAYLDGVRISSYGSSQYVTPGLEFNMPVAIPSGGYGRFQMLIKVQNLVFQDRTRDDYASFKITPTWFGDDFVRGRSAVTLRIHLPEGIRLEEVLYQEEPFTGKFIEDGHTVAEWKADYEFTDEYMVGVSFPKRAVQNVIVLSTGELLNRWYEANKGWLSIPIVILTVAIGITGMIRLSGPTGIGLIIFGIILFFNFRSYLPAYVWLALVIVFALIVEFLRFVKKPGYLPAIASVESGGIKRGLTAPEAAALLELPQGKLVALVLYGLLKKGCISKNVNGEYVSNTVSTDTVIHPYEKKALELIKRPNAWPDRPYLISDIDFAPLVKSVASSVAGKVKGHHVEATRQYYKQIVARAWTEAKETEGSAGWNQKMDEKVDWMMIDSDFENRFRPYSDRYSPSWSRRSGASGYSAPSQSGSGSAGPRISDIAGSFAGWMESTAGSISSSLTGTSQPLLNLQGLHDSGSSGSGSRGGGGGGCACACAGCACACACAGGGR